MLSLLFGLGWGIGLIATTSIPNVGISATLQAAFILLTAFQGLLLFVMNCVRSEDARKVWVKWVYSITCERINLENKTFKNFTSLQSASKSHYQLGERSRGSSNITGNNTSKVTNSAVKSTFLSSLNEAEQKFDMSTSLEPISDHTIQDSDKSLLDKECREKEMSQLSSQEKNSKLQFVVHLKDESSLPEFTNNDKESVPCDEHGTDHDKFELAMVSEGTCSTSSCEEVDLNTDTDTEQTNSNKCISEKKEEKVDRMPDQH